MNTDKKIHLGLIVARAQNRVIGHAGKMPWHLPSELAHFKRTTSGKPVLMGRRTWDSLDRKPLPERDNLILSHNADFIAPGARVFDDFAIMLEHARACARQRGVKEMVVIGGAMLYGLALPLADRVYLTEIAADIPGDTWFDDLPQSEWKLTGQTLANGDGRDQYAYAIRRYERQNA